jgi:hypothetical protein
MNTRRKLRLHALTLGIALKRGAQADVRGATQVLDRGVQAVARGSCLSQVLGRGVQAVARGSCLSQVLGRGAQAGARGAVPCASQVLGRGAKVAEAAVSYHLSALTY